MEKPTPRRDVLDKMTRPSRSIRVVAKIRGFADLEAGPANSASVIKPRFSGDEQTSSCKESYKLDYCYEQNEGNDMIFEREVKPLIHGVFDGLNATIIAFGARGSGKTHVIQGSDKEPGLAVLAVAEFLSRIEEIGRSISVSVYEISQDHVHDLLDPKQSTVTILKDGQGIIQLKGLSQVPVKSISEFEKLYLAGNNSSKPMQKIASECTHRSHKGLIVHISSTSETVSKMNFVDLAGFEDARRKSSEGLNLIEITKVNNSIYALHKVVNALNANENHVPYRESKLTRMLQDSLGGKSRILMLTCLNPSFCQDSMYMMSLASQSCQAVNRTVPETAKKVNSSAKPMVLSSHKSQLTGSVSTSRKPQMHFSIKKAYGLTSEIKERKKLFDEASHLTKSKKISVKASSSSDIALAIDSSVQQEVFSPLGAINPQETIVLDKSIGMSSRCEVGDMNSPWENFNMFGTEVKRSYVQNYLQLLNTGSKEQLKSLKGIGEKRASSILKLRDESLEPFKELDDLKALNLSSKQIAKMMKMGVGDIFS
ncbi:hypothetical protein LWI29_025796 [Acer saccharum]|uniref:Kinesin motor domain-containing protein n=1 Tax=Acer saccharum TaxID=4024 RepID=A0AA39SIZ5_ACESA|nr:hypothetical protein LWI29_025796 [Acer saccharum]